MLNVHKLFGMQRELDERIQTEHHLQNKNLLEEKVLALLVELGELANETRCFKFWSKKPAAPREVILEEYVDGVHFILSIGLELNAEAMVDLSELNNSKTLVEQFNKMYESITSFKLDPSISAYNHMFQEYLYLGNLLGFSSDQVEAAYCKKNEVNHQRQDQGY